jgi:hypothetical protein
MQNKPPGKVREGQSGRRESISVTIGASSDVSSRNPHEQFIYGFATLQVGSQSKDNLALIDRGPRPQVTSRLAVALPNAGPARVSR